MSTNDPKAPRPPVNCQWEKEHKAYVARCFTRVPNGVSVWEHTRTCLDAIADRLGYHQIPVDRHQAHTKTVTDPPGYTPGTYLSVAYPYTLPANAHTQACGRALLAGWETGALIRVYTTEGTPEQVRTIPDLLCSPHSPLLDHYDPGWSWMCHFWWLKGLTQGRAGKPKPQPTTKARKETTP